MAAADEETRFEWAASVAVHGTVLGALPDPDAVAGSP
jgi:hypothetical protein